MESVLMLESVVIGYKRQIYPEINAELSKGEVVALIGPNGIGKSTLLKSISGIQKFRRGSITVMGKKLYEYKPGSLAQEVSYVPSQSQRAKNLSLFDMVSTGCYRRSDWLGRISSKERQFVVNTLKKVGLSELAGRDSSELSDGEYQRAAIARSLVQNSSIILLDEPTAFLDIENKITVTRLLKEIAGTEGKSIIFSTHDLQQAVKICNQIWIMGYDGFMYGTPDELITQGAFEKIFKSSSLIFDKRLFTFV